MKPNTFLSFLGLMLLSTSAFSQQKSWQWGHQVAGEWTNSNQEKETVHDMAVDNAGNIYAIGMVNTEPGFRMSGYSGPVKYYGDFDVIVYSLDCNGNLRWHK